MKEKKTTLLSENLTLLKASKLQKEFITDSTYSIMTPGGRNFERTFELLAQNALSGKILVKEKVLFGTDKYEKIFVLSKEGKAEKFRGESF